MPGAMFGDLIGGGGSSFTAIFSSPEVVRASSGAGVPFGVWCSSCSSVVSALGWVGSWLVVGCDSMSVAC